MGIPLHERLDRLAAWLERRNDRPLIGFCLGSYYPLHRYPGSRRHIPDGAVRPEDVVVEDYLEDTERLYVLHEEAGGDMVWAAAPFLGMPWVEAALGCGVVADHGQGSTRSVPPPGFDGTIPAYSEDNPWVAKMLEFAPALARQSGGRYPVGVTLMRGISDLLSALYGGPEFVLRLCDGGERIEQLIENLTGFWIAMGRSLLARLPQFHGGTGSYLYGLWCPGKIMWLQEDAAALLSPSLYDRFIHPADRRIASAFENCIVHLHPSRFIPAKQLAASSLAAIELHIDFGGPRAEALEPHYRTIMESKPLFVWGDITAADLEFLLTRLPHQGLAIEVVVNSVAEARETWERAMRLLGARCGLH